MLATIGIVDCIFHRVASAHPVSILGRGERLFRFRLNGTERNGSVTVFFYSYCMYYFVNYNLYLELEMYELCYTIVFTYINFTQKKKILLHCVHVVDIMCLTLSVRYHLASLRSLLHPCPIDSVHLVHNGSNLTREFQYPGNKINI